MWMSISFKTFNSATHLSRCSRKTHVVRLVESVEEVSFQFGFFPFRLDKFGLCYDFYDIKELKSYVSL